jgi:hypothetical protein
VHVQAEALADDAANVVTEDNAIIPIVSVQRLSCDAAVNAVVEAPDGSVVGLGRTTRTPSAWMMRQLRHRDRACTFPAAATGASHMHITSSGGHAAVEPIWTTWRSSARSPSVGARVRVEPRAGTRRRGPVVPAGRGSLWVGPIAA